MSIVRNGNSLEVLTPKLTFIFCYIVMGAGFYSAYLMSMGESGDIFGTFLIICLPLLVLNFIYPKKIVFTLADKLRVERYFLFRRSVLEFDLSTMQSIELIRPRGGGNAGNFSIFISANEDKSKGFGLLSKLYDSSERRAAEEFLSSVNGALK